MMMAQDSTPDGPRLSEASVTLLRSALQEYLASNETPALDGVLRLIAIEARDKKMLAEHLLISLKDVWFALPEIRDADQGEPQTRLLQRVVTLCIRAYYTA
jgi:hypothetical protein